MRGKGTVRGRITAIAVIAIALFAFSDVLAQPNIVECRDLIKVSVNPASIPADGVSTSRIEIAVFSPEMLGGEPAAHTKVEVSTDLGTLRDAENESNSGSKITLFTNDTAIAVALLSGDEPGKANITVRAPSIEKAMNLELGNETTVYIVKNSTTVTFLEEKVTKTDCGWRFYLKKGVDYISMPAIPNGDASPDAVFGADVEIWEWDATTQTWVHPRILEAGKGYLIRCPEHRRVDIYGTNAGTITWGMIISNLNDGWNLIGVGDKNVEITTNSPNITVLGWDAVYDRWITLHKGDILYRGRGYWIYKG